MICIAVFLLYSSDLTISQSSRDPFRGDPTNLQEWGMNLERDSLPCTILTVGDLLEKSVEQPFESGAPSQRA